MKIYFTPNTAGRYGGVLKGNLRFLPELLQSELDTSNFKSSFDELWLTLSYPPMYVLSGVVGIEKNFMSYYNALPYSRLNRKYKKAEIALKAPEFSEHFDLEDRERYNHKFEIESRYKGLSETSLALVLIDKYLEAGKIIEAKKKKEDSFDFAHFSRAIGAVKEKISDANLQEMAKTQSLKFNDRVLQDAMATREKRKLLSKPKDQRVRDFRIYSYGLDDKALYPYSYQFAEIFRNLLRRSDLLCPGYHHLYIQVVKTWEEGLRISFAHENWYVNGIAVIDFEKFLNSTSEEKEKMMIDLIEAGLTDIATMDNLDMTPIKKVIEIVRVKGLNTELIWSTQKNSRYKLTISYFVRSMEEGSPVYFTVLEKATNREGKIEIGRVNTMQTYFWLQKVSLSRDKIKVKSSESIAAQVSLHDLPRAMEFNIADILSKGVLS